MKVVYFAWVRERIGKAEEIVDPPPAVRTVADLIGWLTDSPARTGLRDREKWGQAALPGLGV